MDLTLTILNVLITHSVITVPGFDRHRSKCFCGWTNVESTRQSSRHAVAHHQAAKITETLNRGGTRNA